MGCGPSKILKHELKDESLLNSGVGYMSHVVSLTSSTYGVLNMDSTNSMKRNLQVNEVIDQMKRMSSSRRDKMEMISYWELIEGLDKEEEKMGRADQVPKSPKVSGFGGGIDSISPMKFFSPQRGKRFGYGKENRVDINGAVLRSVNKMKKASPNSQIFTERNWIDPKGDKSYRRSLSPLFDPELLDFFEKDLTDMENEFKKTVNSLSTMNVSRLESFIQKCPPGGKDSVIIYTTTLRGIRKTFEDCNIVRSIIESYEVHFIERDISMDSGFKEELRKLMGIKAVKVPMLFIKGRMIGGAEVVVKMDEEGNLSKLLEGVPRAVTGSGGGGCVGCGGVRFVMCGECNGSCKVLDDKGRKSLKCRECNENGLIHCPVCS